MAKALLTLAVVAAAASVGTAPLAGAAVAVSDLPCLVAAVAAGGSGLLRWAARALLFVALWTCPPGLLYAAVSMGPRPAPADARPDTACRLLTAALSVLAMARMAAVLQRRRS
ncbi:hypothetical protein IWQ57_000805 [Coemansia nantahalensis]|uniref:Uncharacterized protein n=1 Tax=Coemansia nantahalensis TaxID=2789366 RepID=A0ACC1K6Q1_9FUNG|nr:hypothetical protein IWQ57_000805 [Coemansia nantahalensis]